MKSVKFFRLLDVLVDFTSYGEAEDELIATIVLKGEQVDITVC